MNIFMRFPIVAAEATMLAGIISLNSRWIAQTRRTSRKSKPSRVLLGKKLGTVIRGNSG